MAMDLSRLGELRIGLTCPATVQPASTFPPCSALGQPSYLWAVFTPAEGTRDVAGWRRLTVLNALALAVDLSSDAWDAGLSICSATTSIEMDVSCRKEMQTAERISRP